MCPSAIGQILVKLVLETFVKICQEIPNFLTVRQKYWWLCMFVVAGDTELPQKQSLQVRWYQCVRIAKEVSTLCAPGTVLCYTCIDCLLLI